MGEQIQEAICLSEVVHRVERVPLRPGPYRRDRGLIPARGPMLHTFLS